MQHDKFFLHIKTEPGAPASTLTDALAYLTSWAEASFMGEEALDQTEAGHLRVILGGGDHAGSFHLTEHASHMAFVISRDPEGNWASMEVPYDSYGADWLDVVEVDVNWESPQVQTAYELGRAKYEQAVADPYPYYALTVPKPDPLTRVKGLPEPRVFTFYLRYYNGTVEVLDVLAMNADQAREFAQERGRTEYEPGFHLEDANPGGTAGWIEVRSA